MNTRPVVPARIEWADDGTPQAPQFGDVYHARVGALAQARHVFLAGNGLPQRWAEGDDFTIAELGFGLGNNFLATWRAWQSWREAAGRPARLHYVALDAHPPTRADLQRAQAGSDAPALAQALCDAWPPLVPGLHRIDLDGGALRLLLAWGDVRDLLSELVFQADAFYLDGFAPALNPAMWDRHVMRALGRRARPGATAATWSVARAVRDGLSAAGFDWMQAPGIGGKRDVLRARYAPRHPHRTHVPAMPVEPERKAIVIGAGLAGASVAAALADLGWQVQVLDRLPQPAGGSSGNPAGLFHATLHGDDSPYARLFRAAALHTAALVGHSDPALVPQGLQGLLRLEHRLDLQGMQALIAAQGLPADFVQALDPAAASRTAGAVVAAPAWFYPGGGWVSPTALVRHLLDRPGIQFRGNTPVHGLRQDAQGWTCLDDQGLAIATAPQVVLAHAEQANALLTAAGWPALPLQRTRGQVTVLPAEATDRPLRIPLAGDGYALPLPDGRLLCGATTGPDDDDPAPRAVDHRSNLERLQRLCGLQIDADAPGVTGRVGWRVQPVDRLPVAGPLPARHFEPGTRLDQARLVPRQAGLHLAVGFGARGITLAPLLGELVAARITGTPVPLEQSLIDIVDPARWIVRAARLGAGRPDQ